MRHPDGDWPDHFEITDPQAIELLTTMRALRYLNPFMRDAHTLTSAAAAVHRPASSVAYWVPRFVRVGLIVHLGDEARAGAAMPVYRAPGRRLTVPFALLDDGRKRVLDRFLDGIDEQMAQTDEFALEFGPSGETGTSIQMLERPGQRRDRGFTDAWMMFDLTDADALQLSRDMEELMERYAAKTGPNRYVVHGGVAKTARHPWRSAGDPVLA
jgi:hypothetical protein